MSYVVIELYDFLDSYLPILRGSRVAQQFSQLGLEFLLPTSAFFRGFPLEQHGESGVLQGRSNIGVDESFRSLSG